MLDFSHWSWPQGSALKGVALLSIAILLHLTSLDFRQKCEEFFLAMPAPVQALVVIGCLGVCDMFMTAAEPYVYFQF
jgi:hypothetical protein